MAKTVAVSPAQVDAAKAVVAWSDRAGREVRASVRRIASATAPSLNVSLKLADEPAVDVDDPPGLDNAVSPNEVEEARSFAEEQSGASDDSALSDRDEAQREVPRPRARRRLVQHLREQKEEQKQERARLLREKFDPRGSRNASTLGDGEHDGEASPEELATGE